MCCLIVSSRQFFYQESLPSHENYPYRFLLNNNTFSVRIQTLEVLNFMRWAWFHCGTFSLEHFRVLALQTHVNKLAKNRSEMPLCCFGGFWFCFLFLNYFLSLSVSRICPPQQQKKKSCLLDFICHRGEIKPNKHYAAHQTMHVSSTLNQREKKKSNKAGFCLMKQRSKIVGDTAQIFRFSHPRLSLGGLCKQNSYPEYQCARKMLHEQRNRCCTKV